MSPIQVPEPRWPKWSEVLDYWQTLDVPGVEIRPWSVERGNVARWDKKAEVDVPNHWYSTTSPQDQTAHHLVREWPGFSEELRAAYVLEAFCRGNRLDAFLSFVVRPVNKRLNVAPYGWWHANAKQVVPVTDDYWPEAPRSHRDQALRWREVVHRAAEEWRSLAAEWVVIRVPELMDGGSEEYSQYSQWARREIEAQERREFERLRLKFDSRPSDGSPAA